MTRPAPRWRKIDWVAMTTVIITAVLALSLFQVVRLLSDSQNEVRHLRTQQEANDDAAVCRARFIAEDQRLGGFRDVALLQVLIAATEQPRDPAAIERAVTYARSLGPASIEATDERNASSDACTRDPSVMPTLHDVPPPTN